MARNLNDINEIKKEYGEIVTNTAIFNLLNFGINSYENVTLVELIKSIDSIYDELDKQNRKIPITKSFLKQVAGCQMNLMNLEPLALMTYFSKPTKKEDNSEKDF